MRKKTFPLAKGFQLAAEVIRQMDAYVHRFAYMGSLGRWEDVICDIDILVEPRDIKSIKSCMESLGEWVRGGERQMTVKNILGSDVSLDLFLCHPPAQWGVITAVRLNPKPLVIYGKEELERRGYRHVDGTIHYDTLGGTDEIDIPFESDWFDLIEVEYVRPEDRWELTRKLRLI
jgi:hypothetical protein